MPLKSPESLFLHDLSSMYVAEMMIAAMLPVLASEVKSVSEAFANALLSHERETAQQIKNLEDCFELLGAAPQKVANHTFAGLDEAHQATLEMKPPAKVLAMFNAGAAAKTEHLEIASYSGLIQKATLLLKPEVSKLLEENLKQEREMLFKVEAVSRQLDMVSLLKIAPELV